MCLNVWEGSITDANLVSHEGVHTQPDEDDYDGTAGEAKERKLILAPAQTTLAEDIDTVQTKIKISAAVFDDLTNFPYIILVSGENSEIMEITGGSGTTTLTVIRDDSPISASASDSIFSAYTYEDIAIQASDESGSDETGWFTYAPDVAGSPGEYGASLSPSDFTDPKTDFYTFWRKVTVPVSTVQKKDDMRHKADFVPFAYVA